MSGNATPIGLAFAVGDGVMVTSCHGVAPTAQLILNFAPRLMPARVASVDEKLGLCKLAAEGVGSRPLPMSGAMPKAGETVYATKVNAVGEVALIEGRVTRIVAEPHGNIVDSTIPIVPERAGGPLLDVHGRVVAVASFSHADGRGRHMAMPPAWVSDISAPPSASPAPAPAPSPAEPVVAARESPRVPKSVEDIPPERREKLEKAFRPPPTVPSDL
jgi:S1-C subfamily serine protease